jgi:hypothetical protein
MGLQEPGQTQRTTGEIGIVRIRVNHEIATWALLAFLALLFLSSVLFGDAPPGTNSAEILEIQLAGGNDREAQVANQLMALAREFDLRPWVFTYQIRIKSDVIPHSHPVLTLHTLHLDDPDQLLATFIHEQIHWFVNDQDNEASMKTAVNKLRKIYPDVPDAINGGARSEESTYLHLIVNWLEFDALVALLGPQRARTVLEDKNYYEWIYSRVLADSPQLESICSSHGLRIDR